MFLHFLLILSLSCVSRAANRPRGVSFAKASHYLPGKDFICLSSGETVPYEYVNDDYCDCKDGTDEPGTSACTNGVYFCENRGHRNIYIGSSRVNDGICDCCDGSDEYEGRINCVNTCDEIGKKEREEKEAFRQLQEQGFKVRQEYVQQGKRTKDEKRSRLSELEKQITDVKTARDEMQAKKDEAEAPEKEAKEKHEKAWQELKAKKEAEKEHVKAALAFAELDRNSDKVVDYVEMQNHIEFDIDADGTVNTEEAREYLNENDYVDLEKFQDKVWSSIKDIYKWQNQASQAPPTTQQPLPDQAATPVKDPIPAQEPKLTPDAPVGGSDVDLDVGGDDDDDDDDDDDEDRDYYEEEEERGEEETKKEEEEEKMPPYDPETQKLIEQADAVRKEFNEADEKVRNMENEINTLKAYLDVDYGPDEEYSALRGQCFEFTDREYTYKLCPFDKTVQKPKAGGIETSLGKWGHWYGPEEDKYDAMKYENGQNCWNGPNRSCHVNLHCGTENKLTGASEPSRCEYQFEFTTPSRCKQPEPPVVSHEHQEL